MTWQNPLAGSPERHARNLRTFATHLSEAGHYPNQVRRLDEAADLIDELIRYARQQRNLVRRIRVARDLQFQRGVAAGAQARD